MAGYNPLSYFSFGKKKDSPEATESAEQLERGSSRATSSASSSARADTAPSAAKDSAHSSVDTDAEQEPLLKVVKGSPTPEEIAALTAVVAMMQANAAQKEQNSLVGAASRILNRGQRLGVSLRPGPGSWRRARPR
ncbi:acyl-CoA carboxylase subunit epsilon [Rothia sp. (in: high G+C Gram-positive bacteria)]|uniref:acyl-CoA carboxylase subunit epsilon n=1 Tax=Rothia sp. (in: high G+C Gram-positive bacteria) TaxID=1885016 RepID=UPI001CB4CF41|nr:acyl-CoA carboxylase subunit epsilon [Rothia sp. (in: high G+C Gram-positive bacteria)]MBF1665572.1 acyl-CoA carboxylase subunit epsilon [Rothia sp. (in: high G+C Gram-positive bacteria)]MBF1668079.1 acyl-CoA carboxylase subunit epsilon [Rothia sp. (in: high G+C Gram-positive bacteria)]